MKTFTTDPLWTWAIFDGVRPLENRPVPTDYRGTIGVIASRSFRQTSFIREWMRVNTFYLPPDDDALFREFAGRMVGEVDLVGCVRVADLPQAEREFAIGPWCWRLRRPRAYNLPIWIPDVPELHDIDLNSIGTTGDE